jgi:uncharacterized membrane protein
MSEWYYAENNEQKGPTNEAELKEKLAANKLPADTLVWQDGMENWAPANQVAAFSFRQPPAPAKVQPSVTPIAATTAPANPESTQPLDITTLLGTPETLEVTAEDAEKNKVYGMLAYISILFIVPLIAAKDSPFGKYHANQGLALFLLEVAIWIVMSALYLISFILPGFLAWIIGLLQLVYLLPFGLLVLGIINAANGKCVPLPLIGGIKLLK